MPPECRRRSSNRSKWCSIRRDVHALPLLAALGGGGKEWLKLDSRPPTRTSAICSGVAGAAFGSDPSAFLQFLEGAGKVTEVGQEDVRGVVYHPLLRQLHNEGRARALPATSVTRPNRRSIDSAARGCAERSVRYARPNRGRIPCAVITGVTRPRLSQSSDSTSRAGHSAGRLMPDVARERVAKPPAGTAYFAPAPEPAGPSAPNYGRG